MWQEIPIRYGHAPDLPRTSPDAFLIRGAVPLAGGIGPDYTCEVTAHSIAAKPLGGAEVTTVQGTRKSFFGTANKLWEWDGTNAPTDRSGSSYSASEAGSWSFAQYGNNTLAVNPFNGLQRSTGGNFATVANAPMGQIVVNAGFPASPQIFIFNYRMFDNNPMIEDGWFASDLGTDTGWSGLYANLGAYGQLLEPVGPITAAVAFRDGVVAFKRNAMFYGELSPDGVSVIQWRRISGSVGCIGKNAVVQAEDAVYFASDRGFYRYDGSYPQKLPGFVHEEWARFCDYTSLANSSRANFVFAHFVNDLSVVRWTAPGVPGAQEPTLFFLGRGYLHNIKSGLWTRWVPWREGVNQPIALAGYKYGATSSGTLLKQTTDYVACDLTTPIIGTPRAVTTLRGFWPTWKAGLTEAGVEFGPNNETWIDIAGEVAFHGTDAPNGNALTGGSATAAANGRADGMASGQWVYAQADIKMASYWEFGSVALDLISKQQ